MNHGSGVRCPAGIKLLRKKQNLRQSLSPYIQFYIVITTAIDIDFDLYDTVMLTGTTV